MEALGSLVDCKKLPFKTGYNAMKIASKIESEVKAINLFLQGKMKEAADFVGKKEDELTVEQKETLASLNKQVEEFMAGDVTINWAPIAASYLEAASLSPKEIFSLVEFGIVKDDMDINKIVEESTHGEKSSN